MLTKRQLKLLGLLKQEPSFQTAAHLAAKLGISERTVYTEMKALQNSGFNIIRKRGVGIAVDQKDGNERPAEDENQGLQRRVAVMIRLIFKDQTVTFNALSEEYFVSKTSIKQDFKFIEKTLSKGNDFHLLSDHKGTRAVWKNPEEKLNVLLNFNQLLIEHSQSLSQSQLEDDIDILLSCYPKDAVKVCENILYSYIKENINTISEVYVQSFLSVLIALVYQLLQGDHLSVKEGLLNRKMHAFYIDSAVKILHKASVRLDFVYTNGDIEYLSYMLLNYRFEPIPAAYVDDGLVERLIEEVSQALTIDFSADQHLLEQLKMHIPAMLQRLRSHTFVKNPFTEQIKLEYSVVFNILWLVMTDFSDELGVDINEDEIAFLTIYFQLAIEKAGISRKILVICPTGLVTSELLINRIKNALPSLDTLEVASVAEAAELNLHQYDFVLTTVKLKQQTDNSFYVSPFISNSELISLFSEEKKQNKILSKSPEVLEHYILPHLVFTDKQYASKKDVILSVGKHLEEKQLVTGDFKFDVLKREELGGTDLPLGVAVPHGKPIHVLKTFVALIKNCKKYKWNTYYVDTVFMIGIAQKDLKEARAIIAGIYQIINDEARLKTLRQEKDVKEVLKIVYGKD
ncbi:BglG family transcription antiterminator [Streptococcus caviae]|uniref:BglG family transcription antiterminator n=1 Tax=Streptococcus sp. 'caviae' TaxID=1915004 RepID=UPI00094B990B|nr:PTS sugar transporter subunit IIA [Streptococcus sp. 'caviae']OLN84743.1 hypothetical protein BMI76_01295 [Streptococcus sp. 'caviae']